MKAFKGKSAYISRKLNSKSAHKRAFTTFGVKIVVSIFSDFYLGSFVQYDDAKLQKLGDMNAIRAERALDKQIAKYIEHDDVKTVAVIA